MRHTSIIPRWAGRMCVVAATGPSLCAADAEACRGIPTIVVNDAYRLFPWADVLYACDSPWWKVHNGCPDFAGEKWSSQGAHKHNDKTEAEKAFGLHLVTGRWAPCFSLDPTTIHYGGNSGFQAVNLALLFGANPIVLLGFDMRVIDKAHFFGAHPAPLRNNVKHYGQWVRQFEVAAKALRPSGRIVNCTPRSSLTCFPCKPLDQVLEKQRELAA